MDMTRTTAVALLSFTVLAGSVVAQPVEPPDPPLVNWTAPPYWSVPAGEQARERLATAQATDVQGATTESASPTTILPFTAVTPCRLYDSRANAPFTGDSTFSSNGKTEDFDFYDASTTPYGPNGNPNGCTLPPAGAAGAWSLKFTYRTSSAAQGVLTAFPGNLGSAPAIGTILGVPGAFTSGSAIVPAGSDADTTIKLYVQYAAAAVVIDYNGYFAKQPVVTTLNTLSGDVTLSPGSNIAITPSSNTLTIAMTGVAGGTLPGGTSGQTLYSNGSGWLASSVLTNDGLSNIGISGDLNLPATTSIAGGVINFGGFPFIHCYFGVGTFGFNTFVGTGAGNFTMGGTSADGSINTAVGASSLSTNTTGYENTAIGYFSLHANTSGADNTASGAGSLAANTTGAQNTASGVGSLNANTTGNDNTAAGTSSLGANTTANGNTAVGYEALQKQSYDPGSGPWDSHNTAVGLQALYFNQPTAASNGIQNTALGGLSLYSNTTGSNNVAVGHYAGFNLTTGNLNIDIGNEGVAGEANTIRIGNVQTRTFIAGIRGIPTGQTNAVAVLVDSNGQLGTVSSSLRFKQDVADMGDASSRLMELRPVTFHYKTQPNGPLQYGLIAEEVNEVMPELVVRDATGQIESVAYHVLPAMLLNELQKQQTTIQAQQAQIESRNARIASLESRLSAQQTEMAAFAVRLAAIEARPAAR